MARSPLNPAGRSRSERYLRRTFLRGREADRDYVVAALNGPDHRSRIYAAGAAADLGATEAIPQLLYMLRASDPQMRVAAAEALGKLNSLEATQPLCDIAASDEVGWVRSFAAEALARLGDPRSTTLLVDLLASNRWRDRMAAAHALGLVGDPAAFEAVEAARRQDRWHWRYLLMSGAYRSALKNLQQRHQQPAS